MICALICSAMIVSGCVAAEFVYNGPSGWAKEVDWMPGWPKNQPLPVKMYSGFANVTDAPAPDVSGHQDMMMHYIVMESENDPSKDPVIVWWNGGPGASSMYGLFVENGPMLLNANSLNEQFQKTGIPQLVANPYSWTKFATIVAFGNPPPIGFSYCSPPGVAGNGTACGTWSDTRVGVADAQAIEIVLTKHFPSLLFNRPDKELYFVGESYAGIFIGDTGKHMSENPTRFGRILQHLRGVAFGDACLGGDILCGRTALWYVIFMYGHQQFSENTWNLFHTECTKDELMNKWATLSPQCQSVYQQAQTEVGPLFVYSLYDSCPNNAFTSVERRLSQGQRKMHSASFYSVNQETIEPPKIPLFDGYACDDKVWFTYFARTDVRQSIFVDPNSNFFNADDGRGMNYKYEELDITPWIASLLKPNSPLYPNPVKVMSYNGDTDPAVMAAESEHVWSTIASNHSFPKTGQWRPWTIDANRTIVGGHVMTWLGGNLTYATVKGSGHMVPEFKPVSAYVLMGHFVTDGVLP